MYLYNYIRLTKCTFYIMYMTVKCCYEGDIKMGKLRDAVPKTEENKGRWRENRKREVL